MLNILRNILFFFFAGLLAVSNVVAEDDLITSKQSITVVDDKVNLRLDKADIRKVLQSLAKKGGFSLHLGDDITGTVTLDLQNLSIKQAVQNLTDNLALQFEFNPTTKIYSITHATSFATKKSKPVTANSRPLLAEQAQTPKPKTLIAATNSIKLKTKDKSQPPNVETDSQGRPLYLLGELLITFKEDVTEERINTLHSTLGSTILKTLPKRKLYNIKLRDNFSTEEAITAYQTSGLVVRAGKHSLHYPYTTVPNDTDYSYQWNMDIIQAPQAWDFHQGSPEIVVAVIDTGIVYDHIDLAANIWTNMAELNGIQGKDDDGNGYIDDIRGWDFGNDDNTPIDVNGHGTHIAGIISAYSNNNEGIAGITWNSKIMPLKVLKDGDKYFPTFNIVAAIDYAIDKGAKIVNCSFGYTSEDGATDPEKFEDYVAFSSLQENGILATCAAGNDGRDIDIGSKDYPVGFSFDNIIGVGSTTWNDSRAQSSNFGVTSVDLLAPGDEVYSTYIGHEEEGSVTLSNGDSFYASYMKYSTFITGGLTKTLVDCGQGYVDQIQPEVNNNIALIKRGDRGDRGEYGFTFAEKVLNAMEAGAVGAIIYNNVAQPTPFTGDLGDPSTDEYSPSYWIPSCFITKTDGEILTQMNPAPTVTMDFVLSNYKFLSGTSMAAPHIAGAAAMLYGVNPNLTYLQVRDAILNSVDQIPAADGTTVTGGRLNLRNTLDYVFNLTENFQHGDLNGDNRITLADAIMALRSLTTQDVEFCLVCRERGADVDGDQRFGPGELIYILQKISDLR